MSVDLNKTERTFSADEVFAGTVAVRVISAGMNMMSPDDMQSLVESIQTARNSKISTEDRMMSVDDIKEFFIFHIENLPEAKFLEVIEDAAKLCGR